MDNGRQEKRKPGRPRKARPEGLSGELGARVESLRKKAGLTAEELGRRAGLGQGTALRMERGEQSPTLDTVVAVAHALGMSAAKLLNACAAWATAPVKGD